MEPTNNYLDSLQRVATERPNGGNHLLEVWAAYSSIIGEVRALHPANMERVMEDVGIIMVNLARYLDSREILFSQAMQEDLMPVGQGYSPLEEFVVSIGMLGEVDPAGAVRRAVLALAMFSADHGFELERAVEQVVDQEQLVA